MTDADSAPSTSEELKGLMLHPGLPFAYVGCSMCAQRNCTPLHENTPFLETT